ncbi:deaminase [Legionella sainthelensi]|uniref:deaminase n=1 Tax=Legionella sainthelensi TaxID=28087 RepID=UPI000E1FC25F|nr:deaminase [Legionella sainthelensi]
MDISSELIIALVGGTGTNFDKITSYISSLLNSNYKIHSIKMSALPNKYFNDLEKFSSVGEIDRITFYQDQCDELAVKNRAIMGVLAVCEINNLRRCTKENTNAYIINSLKRKEEFKILRRIYGHNLILISVYEPKSLREKHIISNEIMENSNKDYNTMLDQAGKIMERDKHDEENDHGQHVRDTYVNATYFVRSDTLEADIKRLFNILKGDPIETPTKDEVCMAHAYVCAMRSADLYRQVGAVIADDDGNIISSGTNEVPKFGGGCYWSNNDEDLRDYFVNQDGKPKLLSMKEELATKLIDKIQEELFKDNSTCREFETYFKSQESLLKNKLVKEGLIKDAIEFLRPVHGEEAAICDAALRGVSTKGAILYCNTYPCHLCTKKIIAAGIKKVIYIDPYPKSKAEVLYDGIIADKPLNPKSFQNKVIFESYRGCSPKKYPYFFNLKYIKRFDSNTGFIYPREGINYCNEIRYVSHFSPLGYIQKEVAYIEWFKSSSFKSMIKLTPEIEILPNFKDYYHLETKWLNDN